MPGKAIVFEINACMVDFAKRSIQLNVTNAANPFLGRKTIKQRLKPARSKNQVVVQENKDAGVGGFGSTIIGKRITFVLGVPENPTGGIHFIEKLGCSIRAGIVNEYYFVTDVTESVFERTKELLGSIQLIKKRGDDRNRRWS